MFNNQRVIPAISTHQSVKKFNGTSLDYGILMNFQLAQVKELVDMIHAKGKKALIHLDMIKGLSPDIYGGIFAIQELGVDGLITTKPKVIELCQKRGVIGILRFFLKDRHSLKQSIDILKQSAPDAVEVLPAMRTDIISTIKAHTGARVLMGGLITDQSMITDCLNNGAVAVTVSKESLWDY